MLCTNVVYVFFPAAYCKWKFWKGKALSLEGIQHQRSIEPRTLLGSRDLSPYIKGAKVVSLKLYSLDVPTRKHSLIWKRDNLHLRIFSCRTASQKSTMYWNIEVMVGICSHNICVALRTWHFSHVQSFTIRKTAGGRGEETVWILKALLTGLSSYS